MTAAEAGLGGKPWFLRLVGDEPAAFRRGLGEAAGLPVFSHPWNGLEEFLRTSGRGALPLVGYGSLVNASSAAVTIRAAPGGRARPVAAFGVRRIFNYEMDANHSRYVAARDPDARALLNARVTREDSDCLNGVLLEVPITDLPALRKRETDYDLEAVFCVDWSRGLSRAFPAWILVCPEEGERGRRRVNNNLTPNHSYYRVCRDGASSFGEEFLEAWLDSSCLGDGVTTVREWERENRGALELGETAG